MRRFVVLASVVAVLSVAGLIYAQTSGGAVANAPTRQGLNTVSVYTRGVAKTVEYTTNTVGTGGTFGFFPAGSEIDVTSIDYTVHAGPGEVFQSQFRILYDGNGVVPVQLNSTGSQTIHVTFPTPLPIRDTDAYQLNLLGAASPNTVTATFILNGTDATPPPELVSDSIKVE